MSRDGVDLPPPAIGELPPKRLYNVVDPATLARVYAGSLLATATAYPTIRPDDHRDHARAAVLDFVDLMRSKANG